MSMNGPWTDEIDKRLQKEKNKPSYGCEIVYYKGTSVKVEYVLVGKGYDTSSGYIYNIIN